MTAPRIVLASRSAGRRAMLEQAGIVFETADAGVDEDAVKERMLAEGASPLTVAEALAAAKALAVDVPGALVIGSDQTLELGGGLIDKAASMGEARERLWTMRGQGHTLHSGVAIARDGEIVWRGADSARLIMRGFSEAFLDAYLAREGQVILSSVGCYRLEGLGAQLFERVDGDYFTILGMPLLPLLGELRRLKALPE